MTDAPDPTDPEVPDAKRRRALRRKRSVIVAGASVVGLVLIVILLLYRMGRQVSRAEEGPERAAMAVIPSTRAGSSPAVPAPTSEPAIAGLDQGPSGMPSGTKVAPAAHAKQSPAPDIFRKPAF